MFRHLPRAPTAAVADRVERLEMDEHLRRQIVLGSVPIALFVLMPLFALLLKLGYIGSVRLNLEHLVVALYSHAALLLALPGIFLLVGWSRRWRRMHRASYVFSDGRKARYGGPCPCIC